VVYDPSYIIERNLDSIPVVEPPPTPTPVD
jgi:hypothetical protein